MSTQATQYSYAGLALTGTDGNGCLWTVERTTGWRDGADVRREREGRSQQDGEWPSTPHRGGRTVTWQGKVYAPSMVAVESAGRQLSSVPLTGVVSGSSAWGDLSGDGILDGAPLFEVYDDTTAKWQLTVVLPDPLLYGPDTSATLGLSSTSGTGRAWPRVWPRSWGTSSSTASSLTVANAGTATYWPRLRIDGPVTNPAVTQNDSGDRLAITGDVLDGQWLDVDLKERRVLLNGQVSWLPRVNLSLAGKWLAVPPGGAPFSWTADTAGTNAKLTVFAHEGAYA